MIKTTWNAWCNRCNWKSFVPERMITYICMFVLAEEACVSGLGAAHKSLLSGGRDHCRFPQLFAQPFSVLTALLRTKTCLPLWLPGSQRSAACWRVLLRSQSSREPRPALKAASHHTEDPGGRQEKLHKSSWKLDDCSMCSSLSGDP